MSLVVALFGLCAAAGAFPAPPEYSVYGCRIPCYSLFYVSTARVGIAKNAAAKAFSAFPGLHGTILSLLNSLMAGNSPRRPAHWKSPPPPASVAFRKYPKPERQIMTDDTASNETWTYGAREAVGLFASADALDAAVAALEGAGFDRAAISVLASDAKIRDRLGHLYAKAADAEDDPRAPLAAYEPAASQREGKAAAIAIPVYIGGAAGAFAVVASGGVLAGAIAAALAGSAIGAGIGGLLARAIGKTFKDHAAAQLAQGGIVLWVGVRDAAAEKSALDILAKAGAKDVHVHQIQREWTLKDIPLSTVQPDPLLKH